MIRPGLYLIARNLNQRKRGPDGALNAWTSDGKSIGNIIVPESIRRRRIIMTISMVRMGCATNREVVPVVPVVVVAVVSRH